jgi:hypothetical protein
MHNGKVKIMKKIFIATILIAGLSTPAFAGHCPKDVKLIDEAVSMAQGLSSIQKIEINNLRNGGERLHKNGKHDDALAALHRALNMLGKSH